MTTCPSLDQLEGLTSSKLGLADEAIMAAHVRECPSCRAAVASLSSLRGTEQWRPSDAADAPRPAEGELAATEPWQPPRPPARAEEADPAGHKALLDELRQHPRYRLLGILGRGGMGTVYKAEHRLLDRAVVLKVIRPDLLADPKAVPRFQREARLAARLAHPNIVAVYEAEEFASTQMLVMEFIEGVNLAELVSERGLLPVAEACELIRQAAIGLEYVHHQGLVHRDIKPHNLLVSRAGQVKVLDLGLATLKAGQEKAEEALTADRQFLGTVDYAAPEQWESSREVDIRADIYSLGCTFYYLLAGQAPFPNSRYTTLMQQMWAHSQAPLPPIHELRPDLPAELVEVLSRMLAKNRDDRHASPGEVAAALAPFTVDCNLAEYVRTARRTTTSKMDFSRSFTQRDSAPSGPAPVPAAAPRRKRLLAGISVAAVALLLAGGLALLRAALPSREAGTPAPRGAAPPRGAAARGPAPTAAALAPPPTGPPIRVGVLHSRTGTMAISERPVIDATLLALDEINERGGLLGRPVEAVVVDGESDGPTFAAGAEKLIATEKVCTLFGCWTSDSRKSVLPVLEKYDHLLFYPVQYEGLELSPHVIYMGAAPNQQIIPAVKWCVRSLKKRRLFLVGSDYVFPHTANAIIRDQAEGLGAEIVGERYLRLGSTGVDELVSAIVAARPDAILNTINGDSNIAFFRALRAAGLTPERAPTISFSLSEVELNSLSTRDMVGDFAASSYFQTVDRPRNRAFVERFRARFGDQRVVSDPMEAAYAGVQVWALAVAEAGAIDPARIRQAASQQSYDAPEGMVRIDPATQHAAKVFQVGRITSDSLFEVVYSSDAPIAPVPYPDSRSRGEWDAFLLDLRLGWNGHWANPAAN
jgi:urea transport system substrate-binding protein